MKGIIRVFSYLKNYWGTASGAFLAMIIVQATNLAAPQLLKTLIDQGITGMNLKLIWVIAAALVGVALLRGVSTFIQGYWSEKTAQGIAYELRNTIFEKLQNLSFSYHDQSQTGMLMTRMTSDVELVKTFASTGALQLVGSILIFVATLVILFSMNWILTLIFLAMLPPIIFLFSIFVRKIMPLSKVIQQTLGALNTILQENLAGIRIVKAFTREEYEVTRYRKTNQDLLNLNVDLMNSFSNFFPLTFFIANLAALAVIWVGGLFVMKGSVTLGELVAFTSYQAYLMMPVMMLGFVAAMLSRAEASAERVFEVIDAKSEISEKSDAIELTNIKGRIVFDDVCFQYTGTNQYVLQDVSFVAEPNQTIAIIGQTGSGKSSIINLIPRFYDVTSGKVTIDGIDVRDLKLDSLRRNIGNVLQETTLFSGTIRDNIAYGKTDATEEDIIRVAKAAQAHGFIMEMQDQYNTVLGERGVGLSGGQKQRIAIARALLLQPRILIMDDSTSSVDTETEYLIQKALEDLRKGRTTFIIAQRISTIRNADKILILDQGKLVAEGKHQELLQTSEIYAEILATQFGGKADLVASLEDISK